LWPIVGYCSDTFCNLDTTSRKCEGAGELWGPLIRTQRNVDDREISLNAEDEFQRRHANLVVRLKFRESTALAADAVLILLGVG